MHVTSAVAEQEHLRGLNDEQMAVVTADLRPLRVLAGPGSGKTRVLVTRVAHMILTHGVKPERILCVSFTNKAAQELQSRLSHTIGDAARGVTVGTFHNVCVRVLRKDIAKMEDCGVTPTFTIYDEEDAVQVMRDKWSELMDAAGPDVKSQLEEGRWKHGHVSRLLSLAKNTTAGSQQALRGADLWNKLLEEGRVKVTDEDDALAGPFFVKAVDLYQQALTRFNALDFDDILHFTIRLLSARPSTRGALQHKWPHFLVDEFQDTNLAQYELVKLLAMPGTQRTAVRPGGNSLLVVGDADQAIYGWRGARVDIMRLSFMSDFKDLGARTLTLSSNYRSSPQVLAVASAVLAPSPVRSELRVRPIRDAGPRPALWASDTAAMEADAVADEIIRLLSGAYGGPPVPPHEICILYRINRLYSSFERALLGRGIPYRVVNGIPILQRTEIKDLLCYLRLVANSCDEVALARIINTPKRKVGDTAQAKVWSWAQETQSGRPVPDCLFASPELSPELACELQPAARDGLSTLLRSYAGWQRDLPDLTVEELLKRVIRDVQYASHLELESDAHFDSLTDDGDAGGNASSSRSANVETLLGLAGSVGDPARRGKDALIAFLESLQLQTAVMEMRNTDAVWMGSIHAAKGLEFQAVFCVGLEEGVSPSFMAMKDVQGPREQEVYEEERRLVYVGITRAKQHLYLTHTIRPRFPDARPDQTTEPSPFLHDIHAALGDGAFGIRAVEAEPREQPSGFNRSRQGAARPVAVHRNLDKWRHSKVSAGAARGHHNSARVAATATAPVDGSGSAQAVMPWERAPIAAKARAPPPRGSGGPVVGVKSRVRRAPNHGE